MAAGIFDWNAAAGHAAGIPVAGNNSWDPGFDTGRVHLRQHIPHRHFVMDYGTDGFH